MNPLLKLINRFRVAIVITTFALLVVSVAILELGAVTILVVGGPILVIYGILVWKLDRKFKPEPKPNINREKYVSPFSVTWDDKEIVVWLNGARHESVAWDNLIVVGVRNEDQGFLVVPYWIFGGHKGGCMFPHDAIGGAELFKVLQRRLVGFDNLAVIEVMGMTSGGKVIWQRKDEESGAEAPDVDSKKSGSFA